MNKARNKVSYAPTVWVALVFFAITIAIPLYRPYLIAQGEIGILYSAFVVGAIGVVLIGRTIFTYELSGADLVVHAFFALFVLFSAVGANGMPTGELLLTGFLYLSFVFGRWLGLTNRSTALFVILGVIFLPVSLYVLYQLARSGFSYNIYMNYSNAALKIGYLDFALYSGMLFLVAQESRMRPLIKAAVCGYLFAIVAISGARYSILFVVAAAAWHIVTMSGRNEQREKWLYAFIFVGAMSFLLWASAAALFQGDLFGFSSGRLSSMLDNDQSVGARLAVYARSVEAIMQAPVIGYGMGNGSAALGVNYPHNVVLEVTLEGGVLPGAMLAGLIGMTIVVAVREITSGYRGIGLVALYVIGAFLKSFSFYEARVLFLLMGTVLAIASARKLIGRTRRGRSLAMAPQSKNVAGSSVRAEIS